MTGNNMRHQNIFVVMMQGPEWNCPITAFERDIDAYTECNALNARLAENPHKTSIQSKSRYTVKSVKLKLTN